MAHCENASCQACSRCAFCIVSVLNDRRVLWSSLQMKSMCWKRGRGRRLTVQQFQRLFTVRAPSSSMFSRTSALKAESLFHEKKRAGEGREESFRGERRSFVCCLWLVCRWLGNGKRRTSWRRGRPITSLFVCSAVSISKLLFRLYFLSSCYFPFSTFKGLIDYLILSTCSIDYYLNGDVVWGKMSQDCPLYRYCAGYLEAGKLTMMTLEKTAEWTSSRTWVGGLLLTQR